MENTEIEQYQKLTKFQKDLVDSLFNLGFKHKHFAIYELEGWGEIKVDKFNHWSDVLKCVHEQGKEQKQFEIQRVLGI
jgi:hypothetical protein